VEDDAGTRQTLTRVLELAGAEVRQAGSASDAINTFDGFST
jgi:hypothetical protein